MKETDKETKQDEEKEESSGVEYHDKDVDIPEEFQKMTHELVDECSSKACLSYVRDCVYAREAEIRKEEYEKENKGKKSNKVSEFSMEDAPPMY